MIEKVYSEKTDDLARAGVEIIVTAVKALNKDKIVLAIPGGRSVTGIWKLLADAEVDWSKIHVFMADERVVPPTHEDSNYKLAYDTFLKKLVDGGKLPGKNLHPYTPTDEDDKGGGSYYNELKEVGNPDILILGVGEDGHIGALYPNHHSIKNDAEGYIVMDDSPKPPPVRMSMSRKTMLAASTAILLFIGEGKKEAYDKFRADGSITECPARLAKKLENVFVLTDLK